MLAGCAAYRDPGLTTTIRRTAEGIEIRSPKVVTIDKLTYHDPDGTVVEVEGFSSSPSPEAISAQAAREQARAEAIAHAVESGIRIGARALVRGALGGVGRTGAPGAELHE